MMEQMQKDGIAFDVFTYSGAISACGKGGEAAKALGMLDDMEKQHGKIRSFFFPTYVCVWFE